MAADFNKDGLLDLAVSNHTVDGNHSAFSKVFYNDGNRFANPRLEKLPTLGPHWSSNEDMGHIYNRSWSQTYESSLFKLEGKVKEAIVSVGSNSPSGTEIKFYTRSAENKDYLLTQPWVLVDQNKFKIDKDVNFIQYKLLMVSDNGDRFPTIDWVKIESTK